MIQSGTEIRLLTGRNHESEKLKNKAPPVVKQTNLASHERKSPNKTVV